MADVELPLSATPATPSTGRVRVFLGTDGKLKSVDENGVVSEYLSRLVFLGSTVLGATAAATSVVTISAFTELVVFINIGSYPSADIASLRFNGDTANNYWDRHVTIAAGGTTLTNTQNASTSLIRLASAAVNQGRVSTVRIMNLSNRSKVCRVDTQTLTGAAATVGIIDMGGGEWVNTTDQITSIQMLVAGAGSMSSGSGFSVFGVTPS